MMKIAIAGPSADLDRCERAVFAVRKFGIVTFDWVAQIRQDRAAGLTDDDLTADQREWVKRQCYAGIVAADAVLYLASKSVGAAREIGFAEGLGKVIVEGGGPKHPIYGCARFATDEQAIAWLRGVR